MTTGQAIIGRYESGQLGSGLGDRSTQVDSTARLAAGQARATLFLEDGGLFLTEEVGALNGTLVNGQRLSREA